MLNVRSSVVVVGCVFVGFVTSAGPTLVARAAEPPRWIERALASNESTAVPGAGDAKSRVAQLEQRVKELEAERRGATPRGPASGRVSAELEAVLAQNRELEARNLALATENQALANRHPFERTAAACEPPSSADPRAQIRYWAQQLRDGDSGFNGRMTTEQNAAVQVLLRPERRLDPSNPWGNFGPEAALASAK